MVKKGILYASGQLDCLSYYSKIFPKIKSFVGDRELATKTFVPKAIPPFILHRGSKDPKLTLRDIGSTQSLIKMRVGKHIGDVEKHLNKKQHLVWRYFVPRKLTELHYAVNYEGQGKGINRIFIDLDSKVSEERYLEVVKQLIKEIKKDKRLKKLVSYRIKLIWTGTSVHLYLMLQSKKPRSFYEKYFSFKKGSFTNKWAEEITKKTGVKVSAKHQRQKGSVILDSSATPSGKLGRVPYSLHLNSRGKLTGVSVPIKESDLRIKKFKELKNLTPDKALKY